MRGYSMSLRNVAMNANRVVANPLVFRNSAALVGTTARATFLGTNRFYSDNAKKDASPKEKKVEEPATEEDANLTEDQKKINELQEKYEEKCKESAEYKDRLLRSVADFRNLQEITKKDVQKAKDFALQKFAKDLLESVDNFGHALGSFTEEDLKKSREIRNLYTGVKMTRDIFEKTLKKHGIEKVDPLGEQFDPNRHEATFELPQEDKEPGTVFHVQQVGFTLNSRVIRPAKVGIVKSTE
ncbi:hypothetical protein TPHA_0G01720 [Tetrapisispora phaffii CBS 4417]|uniref:GrpE protein homolog n=1 Tax=Tetrapisispora phaffii (strain ATCC 24235 / CBS 4417 / NBRC 1672 / NRRL Y-8282 / UCD 70-5) TaxID=1071381 RepID=G8BVT0_TETPH|nr:hypothetical protein TPHA_0G01720 [Tetrapisispora phaffii CBS 4417]CCE64008.1 hypothetical protein TPHA_0G01720 [Tetrapisispora phaffii CBS 4417]